MMRLGNRRIKNELIKLGNWSLNGKVISRRFVFADFAGALRFVNRVGKLAEAANHHPDITITYDKVRLALTTHDEDGLTMKDFRLARQINKLATRA